MMDSGGAKNVFVESIPHQNFRFYGWKFPPQVPAGSLHFGMTMAGAGLNSS